MPATSKAQRYPKRTRSVGSDQAIKPGGSGPKKPPKRSRSTALSKAFPGKKRSVAVGKPYG